MYFLQATLVGFAACLNYGGVPKITIYSNQYLGCYVRKPVLELVKSDLKDRNFIFTTGKP